jgi:hypothetical protein
VKNHDVMMALSLHRTHLWWRPFFGRCVLNRWRDPPDPTTCNYLFFKKKKVDDKVFRKCCNALYIILGHWDNFHGPQGPQE